MENELLENELTREIIGCAIEVHKTLGGPGCLEKVYQRALAYELVQKGHDVVMEAECPIVYKGHDISEPNHPLRIDLLVDNRIIVECKSVTQLNPVFYSQCLTYLRLKNLKVGLVINFGHSHLVTGVKRIVNNGLDKPDAADVDASMQFIDQVWFCGARAFKRGATDAGWVKVKRGAADAGWRWLRRRFAIHQPLLMSPR